MANILESGHYVLCPLTANRNSKHPVDSKKLKIDKSKALVVPRCQCLGIEPFMNDCPLCPNFNFKVLVEPLGVRREFDWLDKMVRDLNQSFEAKFSAEGRYWGNCCRRHQGVIVCRFGVDGDRKYLKEVVTPIHDLIEVHTKASAHRLLHIRWFTFFFTLGLEAK